MATIKARLAALEAGHDGGERHHPCLVIVGARPDRDDDIIGLGLNDIRREPGESLDSLAARVYTLHSQGRGCSPIIVLPHYRGDDD